MGIQYLIWAMISILLAIWIYYVYEWLYKVIIEFRDRRYTIPIECICVKVKDHGLDFNRVSYTRMPNLVRIYKDICECVYQHLDSDGNIIESKGIVKFNSLSEIRAKEGSKEICCIRDDKALLAEDKQIQNKAIRRVTACVVTAIAYALCGIGIQICDKMQIPSVYLYYIAFIMAAILFIIVDAYRNTRLSKDDVGVISAKCIEVHKLAIDTLGDKENYNESTLHELGEVLENENALEKSYVYELQLAYNALGTHYIRYVTVGVEDSNFDARVIGRVFTICINKNNPVELVNETFLMSQFGYIVLEGVREQQLQ